MLDDKRERRETCTPHLFLLCCACVFVLKHSLLNDVHLSVKSPSMLPRNSSLTDLLLKYYLLLYQLFCRWVGSQELPILWQLCCIFSNIWAPAGAIAITPRKFWVTMLKKPVSLKHYNTLWLYISQYNNYTLIMRYRWLMLGLRLWLGLGLTLTLLLIIIAQHCRCSITHYKSVYDAL